MKISFSFITAWYHTRKVRHSAASGLRQFVRVVYLIVLTCAAFYVGGQSFNSQLGVGSLVAGVAAVCTLIVMAIEGVERIRRNRRGG